MIVWDLKIQTPLPSTSKAPISTYIAVNNSGSKSGLKKPNSVRGQPVNNLKMLDHASSKRGVWNKALSDF